MYEKFCLISMFIGVVCAIVGLITPPKSNECSKALDELNQSLINAIKENEIKNKNMSKRD